MISYFQRKDLDHFNMNKFKKRVLKQFPNAYIESSADGLRIFNNDESDEENDNLI